MHIHTKDHQQSYQRKQFFFVFVDDVQIQIRLNVVQYSNNPEKLRSEMYQVICYR